MSRRFPVLCLLGGCYTYAPIDPLSVTPGMGLRARITAEHAQRIAPLLGATDPRLLTGKVISIASDTLIVEVPTMDRIVGGGSVQPLHQRVGLPRASIVELETRTLNRRKTSIVAAAATFIVASFLVKTLIIDPGRERSPIDPGGTEFRPRE